MNTQAIPMEPKLTAGAPLAYRPPTTLRVKLIGAGGVGEKLARNLVIYLAAQPAETHLSIIDGDAFEPANAARMWFANAGNKAAVLRAELLPRLLDSALCLVAIEEFVTRDNLPRLIQDGDIVLLAVDNHATRKLVNDHCANALRDVCVISGGNDGVGPDSSGAVRHGTYGTVQFYLRQDGVDVTPSLTRYHPEIERPKDRLPTEASCTELAASVPQILFTNLTVAAAMLSTLWLYVHGAITYRELAFDIAEGRMVPTWMPTHPAMDAASVNAM
jgi:molybdopterin/thiamine biosynthesis adenylyltransferase